MATPTPTATFTLDSAKKIAVAVRSINAIPKDHTGQPGRGATPDNRFFWLTVPTVGGVPYEVIPKQVLSSGPTPTPTGEIKWVQAPGNAGDNRGVFGKPYSPIPSIGPGVGANECAYLVRQDFDTSVEPPVSVVSNVHPFVMVGDLVATATGGTYEGVLGESFAPSPGIGNGNCTVLDMGAGAGPANAALPWGCINAAPDPAYYSTSGAYYHAGSMVTGWVVGQDSAEGYRPIVAVNLEHQSKPIWVKVTIDGGADGTSPTSFAAATQPSYTYTVTTTSGPSGPGDDGTSVSGAGGVTLATGKSPIKRRPGTSANAGFGIGWISQGVFTLFDAGE